MSEKIEKNKGKSWYSRKFRLIILSTTLLVLVVALGSYAKIYIPMQVGKEYKVKYDHLYNEHETLKAILEDTTGPDIDPVIVEWAYSNAARHVPKVDIVRILKEASKYSTFKLILSVWKEESGFDVYARSNKNAKGGGQIMTSVWLNELTKEGIFEEEIDAFDYRKNIAATDYILRKYKKQYGGWNEVLNRYVNGDSKYVTRVLANYAELSLLAEESAERAANKIAEEKIINDLSKEDLEFVGPVSE